MIESRVQPVVRIVAHFAINRIQLTFMIFSIIILNLVTGYTISFSVQESPFMTIGTLNHPGMTSGQFKACGDVVKGGWFPR